MKKRLISIIINCYNGEKYLSQTLNSILSQKYKRYEVIFIDNCSTDSSAKIFKNINDKRFKYFKTLKKVKLYDGRNIALRKCKGKFITFIDVDDWWDKNFLSSREKFFNSSKNYGFCYSNCYHYLQNTGKYKIFYKKILPSGFILNDLLRLYCVKVGTIIIKKHLFKKYKFNSNFNIIGDYDLIIRMSKKYKAMSFNDKLVYIRVHENNFSHNNRKMFYIEFKRWLINQNFKDKFFKCNKSHLYNKLEYLRLTNLLFNHKKLNLIFDIIRFPSILQKTKLLIVYFLPSFLLNFVRNIF